MASHMASQKRRRFNTFSSLLDVVIVVVSMAIAYWIRFTVLEGDDPVGDLTYHLLWALAISPVFIFLYGLFGANDFKSSSVDLNRLLGRSIAATTLSVSLFIVCIFVFNINRMSRWLIVIFWVSATLLSCLKVIVFSHYLRSLHRNGLEQRRVVLIGAGPLAYAYYTGVTSEEASPYKVLGNIGVRAISGNLLYLGSYADIDVVLDTLNPDEVIVALESSEHLLLEDILFVCEKSGCKVSILPLYYQYLSNRPHIGIEGGIPLINVNHVVIDNLGYSFVKRTFDIVGSILLIVFTSPIMLIAAIGTKISSPGPVIFSQIRVGRGREIFKMYKFRSMRVDSGESTGWTTTGDPRRTRFGAFMRRFSIDELPQLFNVLRGDMSLVGPRPEIPEYVERFKTSVPLYMVRHQVRPGMTGLAQINGLRGDTSIEERVQYDLYYINNWSILLDIQILLLTPTRGVFKNDQETLMTKNG
ncbi:MAG: undecaprenyl-phosphate glucose phosphotransferase [Coriobacteriales bacterium]|nr:undecaprenyl-phosphate glucose phosphotransferase [Coriobacteriales bacterium]